MWVSGNSVVAVGVSAPASTTSCPRFGDRAERAGDPETVLAFGRTRLDGKTRRRPIEVRELGPADAGARLLRGDKRRQRERVDVPRDRRRNVAAIGETLDRALHVRRAREEARDEIRGHRRPRTVPVRGEVGLRVAARRRSIILAESLAGACQHGVARRPIACERGRHPTSYM
jgi:hypothetical protein